LEETVIFKYERSRSKPATRIVETLMGILLMAFTAIIAFCGVMIGRQTSYLSFQIGSEVDSRRASNGFDVGVIGYVDAGTALRIESAAQTTDRALLVEINSRGGDVSAGLRIAEILRGIPNGAVCTITGEASSIAFTILQACRVRRALPGTFLMTHRVSVHVQMVVMSPADLRKSAEQADSDWIEIRDLIAARAAETGCRSAAEMAVRLEEMTDFHNWEMAPEEAVVEGFLDDIDPAAWKPVDYEEETS
jgi:ATP-dependent protease ClpP protease subunit